MKPLIRVTTLEKFRRFISGEYEYETEQNMMDCITQEFKGNEYTYIGTAFHRVIEGATDGNVKVPAGEREFLYYSKPQKEPVPCGRMFDIEGNKVILDVAQCKVALAYKSEFPNAFHEIREYMELDEAVVTGCADIIDGFTIRDIKTKYSQPDDKDYINSAQWRWYMELFGIDTFHFDLFIFEGYNKEKHGMDVRGLPIHRHNPPITCYYYDDMVADNRYLLREFMKWVRFRDLLSYLPIYNKEDVK